jgi:hypothetical protein
MVEGWNQMSRFRMLAVAAASVALLAGAPAGVAQAPQGQGNQQLLGGQGYQNRDGDRDRDWGDRDRDDRDGRDGRNGGWNGGNFNMGGLQGLRVDSAKDQLRRSGYDYSRAIRDNGKQYDLWSNGRSCVGFTSYNGRVTDARGFRDAECGNITNGWGRINVRELQGLRVDGAKDALRRAGFSYSRAIRINRQQYDLWSSYNGRRNECVGFTSYNGRVTDARNFSDRDC